MIDEEKEDSRCDWDGYWDDIEAALGRGANQHGDKWIRERFGEVEDVFDRSGLRDQLLRARRNRLNGEKKMLKENIEKGKAVAAFCLSEFGEVRSRVVVFSKDGQHGILPYDGSEEAKYATVKTIQIVRKAGLFDFALLISEAWMAALPAGAKREDIGHGEMRASQRPDKREVVIIHAVSDDGKTDTGVWGIVRGADGKPSLGEAVKMDGGESWLDEAVL